MHIIKTPIQQRQQSSLLYNYVFEKLYFSKKKLLPINTAATLEPNVSLKHLIFHYYKSLQSIITIFI